MPHRIDRTGSERLVRLTKVAYWAALLLIAGMALASYLLLQRMITDQQREQGVLSLVSTQRALSQRIVFLANAAGETPDEEKRALANSLREAVAEFEANYDRLLSGLEPSADNRLDRKDGTVENILYGSPHHLDFFSVRLGSYGARFAAALQADVGDGIDGGVRRSAFDQADGRLDAKIADSALDGYSVLRDHLRSQSQARLDQMLSLHRLLFAATLALLAAVALVIFRPISELIRRRTRDLVEARNAMAFLAVHDNLTGLYNRTYLSEQLPALLQAAGRRGEKVAVIQLDLNRFKLVNDTLGHAAGDAILKSTAARLKDVCRASDFCVRLGGDEFVMILPGAGEREAVADLAQRAVAHISRPVLFGGDRIAVGGSAGIAIFPDDGTQAADLVVHADLALYEAKKRGGNTCAFFSDAMRREIEKRRALEAELRRAIAERAFEAYFQPQVSLKSGATTGVEALTRWNHPVRGVVSPAEFIPVAERCGLISEIGRMVIARAIAQGAEWHRAGIAFGRLSVNVSAAELQSDGFSTFLLAVLAQAGLPPAKLSLEIVESVILDDEGTGIAAKLRGLRNAGINLELDDFGTGYASLLHVDPQSIDRLKIDRRFVQNIESNCGNAKIVRALVELAHGLGIAVIAEGAETAAELDALAELGCEEVQGYGVAFPMPGALASEWLSARLSRSDVAALSA
jgi:diguanylate cyclase